jgi:hypothetical protein
MEGDKQLSKDWVWIGDNIDGLRWNQIFPYQLIMVRKQDGGYSSPEHEFTLPIPPQDLTISTPFAISSSVTMGGIVEEHNGAPTRMISFSGTTGVTPLRGSAMGLDQANALRGIFAGTLRGLDRLVTSAKTFIGKQDSNSNLVPNNEDFLKGTGYYQFRLLQRFLESYAYMKKQPDNANLRLALAIWKDQAIYLVTPVQFDVRRSAQSPYEYQYSLSLKAWRRISLNTNSKVVWDGFKPVMRDPNAFAQLLNKIEQARVVLQNSKAVLKAFGGDVEKILFEPLREVVLFAKDVLGVVKTAADLPSSIGSSLALFVAEAKDSFTELGEDITHFGVQSGKAESASGETDSTRQAIQSASPVNKTFENPSDNFELMRKIIPSKLNLPPRIQRKIQEETERVRRLTRLDFERMRDKFVDFAAQFADAVGAGSPTYNVVYNRSPAPANKTPTPSDYEVLFALNQIILELNRLAVTQDIDKLNKDRITTVEAVAGMASASGIAFKTPVSKFAVPFPYGSTLEQLSAQYLGDPNRWHEIAALNGLRQPYVDEVGFDLPLLVNGQGNQVVVADSSNLYVGQPVWISATNTSRTKRRITKIEKLGSSSSVITVDGDPDMDRYETIASATLHAFLPDTVNSQMLIYIPSDSPPEDVDYGTKSIPGIDEFDQLIQVGGVDLLLTQDGDLAVTPDGDCRLAIGLTNLVQRARVAIGTPKGSLLHHPNYGLGLQIGDNTADIDAKKVLAAFQDTFKSDPSFRGVSGVAISKAGPAVRVTLSIGIAGTNQMIPISVDIRR